MSEAVIPGAPDQSIGSLNHYEVELPESSETGEMLSAVRTAVQHEECAMITVKIVFIGLIAFSPMDDGAGYMAVLVDAPGHQTALLQREGECQDPELCQQLTGDEQQILPLRYILGDMLGWSPLLGELVLLDEDGEPLDGGVITFGGQPTTKDPEYPFPLSAEDAARFSWLPSIDRMVTGPARIRGACMEGGGGCLSKARFHIQEGVLSACHMLHRPQSTKPLVYDFGTHEQAVANAVMLEVEVPGREVRIGVRGMDGGEVVHSAALAPNGSDAITLVVMNEPSLPGVAPDPVPPAGLTHFPHFYKLLQLFGRGKKLEPQLTDLPAVEVDFSCESLFEWLYDRGFVLSNFPHGGTECDAVRIP